MKKIMDRPKKDVQADINGANPYEEREEGVKPPPPPLTIDEKTDRAFAALLKMEKELNKSKK